MPYPSTRGFYWMQCTANATSYPGAIDTAGAVTATAGDSVTQNSSRVLIHSFQATGSVAGTITIESHDGSVAYMVIPTAASVTRTLVLDLELPSGFRVVSSGANVSAIITYLPLD